MSPTRSSLLWPKFLHLSTMVFFWIWLHMLDFNKLFDSNEIVWLYKNFICKSRANSIDEIDISTDFGNRRSNCGAMFRPLLLRV